MGSLKYARWHDTYTGLTQGIWLDSLNMQTKSPALKSYTTNKRVKMQLSVNVSLFIGNFSLANSKFWMKQFSATLMLIFNFVELTATEWVRQYHHSLIELESVMRMPTEINKMNLKKEDKTFDKLSNWGKNL